MTDAPVSEVPLYGQQKHLWRARTAAGNRQTAGCAARIEGPLDAARVEQAVHAIVARYDILRTTFAILPGTSIPVQRVADTSTVELQVRDLSETAESLRDQAAAELLREQAGAFDLEEAPLRAALGRFADDRHVLVISTSALCGDAAACWQIVREIASELAGDAPDDEPLQYADIDAWQDELFSDEDAVAGVTHWQGLEPTAGAAVRLGLAYRAGEEGAFAPRDHALLVPGELSTAIDRLAAKLDVARSAIHHAAWRSVLARHVEPADLCLGVTSSGRLYEGIAAAIGPLEKVLPVPVATELDQPFDQLVQAVDRAESDALDNHEYFVLDRVGTLDSFAPPILGFRHADRTDAVTAGDLRFTRTHDHSVTERSLVTLAVQPCDGEEAVRLLFDPDALEPTAAACLLHQHLAALTSACAAPDTPVSGLDLLGDAGRESMLTHFARVAGETPSAPALHEKIAAAAAATPEALAVVAEHERITFGDLDRDANQFARHLQSQGVGPGTIVGIYTHAGVPMITAILGVLKAGGAYLPLPPNYPDDRVTFMLNDAAAPIVITVRQLSGSMPESDAKTLVLDDEWDAIQTLDGTAPECAAGDDDTAYVIYTSGSTGTPKGVLIQHRNLAHSIGAREIYYRQPVTGYLLLSSFAFDSSIPGIFWTLSSGGTLVFPARDFGQDLIGLPKIIAEHRVSHLLALPSLYSVILSQAKPGELDSLTTVVIAGESATRDVLDAHRAALPSCELHNEYGPTEGTVWSSVFDCAGRFHRPTVPIGRPVPGTTSYVLDATGALCPIGVAGELHIGGAGVTPGYHNRPELTAERFLDNPFGDGRLYRTGDVARWLPDGNLEFLGRRDHQVKIRGYRIELEEIENALAEHTAVREAVVISREDTPGEKRLVGYVTAATGDAPDAGAPDAGALRQHLAISLPDYMVPALIVVLDAFPQLPNGKVDRGNLPAPEVGTSGDQEGFVAPRTALERVVADIWAEVLDLDDVSIEDDFFELGGHSLLATQLFARILEYLDVEVPLRQIFEQRTIATLCQKMLEDADDPAALEKLAEELDEEE